MGMSVTIRLFKGKVQAIQWLSFQSTSVHSTFFPLREKYLKRKHFDLNLFDI